MNQNLGKRHKQAVQVLNQVEYDENGNPIGMKEDRTNPASANFGTEREPIQGGCCVISVFDDNAALVPAYEGDISFVIGTNTNNNTQELFYSTYNDDLGGYEINILSYYSFFNIFVFKAGTATLDAYSIAKKFTLTDEELSKVYAWYHCSEGSGNILYDSSGNGNHAILFNTINDSQNFDPDNVSVITDPPEENPNSIRKIQNIYCFENEEGYTSRNFDLSNVVAYYSGSLQNNAPIIQLDSNDYIESGTGTSFKNFINPFYNDAPSNWCFEIGKTYYIKLKVTNLTTGSFVVGVREGISDLIYFNGIYELNITVSGVAAYLEYLSVGNYNCDATIEILEIHQTNAAKYIPKDASIKLPPFKDVLGNNLEYIGKVSGKAKFVQSYCFYPYSNNASINCGTTNIINPTTATQYYSYGCSIIKTDTITNGYNYAGLIGVIKGNDHENSFGLMLVDDKIAVFYFYFYPLPYTTDFEIELNKKYDIAVKHNVITNNVLVFVNENQILNAYFVDEIEYKDLLVDFRIGSSSTDDNQSQYIFPGLIYNAWMEIDGVKVHHWPLCEPVINPSTHIYYDTIGNAHGTLENGTINNTGYQDYYHYSQNGFIRRNSGDIIPIKNDKTGFADGSNLNDNDAILQDGKSFLDCGTKIEQTKYTSILNADSNNNFWFNVDGNSRQIPFGSFKTENPISSRYYFGKNTYSTDNNIIGLTNLTTYNEPLNSKQDNVEIVVRNVFKTESNWLLKNGYWDNTGVWDNDAYFYI